MPFKSKSSGQNYTPRPTGKFKARLIWLVDLGTQEIEWQGQIKMQRKLMMTFETPENLIESDNQEIHGKPYIYSKEFTYSMNEKGNLRPFVENWISKGLTDTEADEFDLSTLVNTPCEIKVMEKKSKDGSKNYPTVTAVEEIKSAPNAVNDIILFDLDEPDWEVAKKLPEWILEKIKNSREYKDIQNSLRQPVAAHKLPNPEQAVNDIGVQMPF